MGDQRPNLQLIENPIGATLWLLQHLPLAVSVRVLSFALQTAETRELLTDRDRDRIARILDQVSPEGMDRAA